MKKFKFKIRGNDYEVEINDFENNIVELEVNGTAYTVELQQEVKKQKTPKLVRASVPTSPEDSKIKTKPDSKVTKILSPLPGTIISIAVKVGDTVNKGDKLMIMEAMKMENNVLAEKGGVVKAILVAPGDTVLQNDNLVEIE